MKSLKWITLLALMFVCLVQTDAQSRQQRKALYSSDFAIELQTLGVGNDGTKLIKVWGFGKKVGDAVYEAKRNAVMATIFRGLPAGGGSARTPAICRDADAYEKNADFFDRFFEDGGRYLNYINLSTDGMPSGPNRLKMKKGYKCAVTVSIDFDNLRKYLEDQGVARRLDSGF